MNLLIAFVILLCLGISEVRDPEFAMHLGQRLALLSLLALLVPGAAIFQTAIIGRRCRNQTIDETARQRIFNRLSASHSAVWLAASLAIVWWLRWPDIVRVNWQCDRWPLLDDLLILAPILLSLFVSWAIFYDVKRLLDQHPTGQPQEQASYSFQLNLPERLQFVGLRFRVYVLMSLLPILATLLARDAARFAQQLPESWQNVALVAGSALVLAFFPLLMLVAWKHGPIEDSGLSKQLRDCCRRLKLGVLTIRAWHTGSQIINAVVTGVIPGLRVIVISDAMIENFPRQELLAVVRHEAGHIRMSHMPIRLFFMLFPLILAAIDQTNGAMIANLVNDQFEHFGLSPTYAVVASGILYALYLLLTLTWLSRQMEFEADWFSVMSEPESSTSAREQIAPNDEQADQLEIHNSMTLAIARLAAHSPEQFERRTLLHPSLKERMQRTAWHDQHRVTPEKLQRTAARRSWFVKIAFASLMLAFAAKAIIFAP